jgi:hypothetical protein
MLIAAPQFPQLTRRGPRSANEIVGGRPGRRPGRGSYPLPPRAGGSYPLPPRADCTLRSGRAKYPGTTFATIASQHRELLLAFVLLVVFVAWVMFSPSSPKNRR